MMDRIDYEAPLGFFAEQSADLIGECLFDLVGEGHPVGPVGGGDGIAALQVGSHLVQPKIAEETSQIGPLAPFASPG